MSETKHSPEPWRTEDAGNGYQHVVLPHPTLVGHNGMSVALDCDAADARRIVACVNACAGIPTEALEAGALGKALDRLAETVARPCVPPCTPDDPADECWSCAVGPILRSLGRLP